MKSFTPEKKLSKELIVKLINWIISLKKKFEDWIDKKERIIHLKKLMEIAKNYEDWKAYAKELDIIEEKEKWKLKL